MNLINIIGIAIVSAILSLTLKRHNPEFSMAINIMSGIILVLGILSNVLPSVNEIKSLIFNTGVPSEYISILLKSLGIAFFTQFSSDACVDAGQTALSSKVELAGKVMILIVSLPLLKETVGVITKLLR